MKEDYVNYHEGYSKGFHARDSIIDENLRRDNKFYTRAGIICLITISGFFISDYRSCKREAYFRNIPAVHAIDSMYNANYMKLTEPLNIEHQRKIDSLKKIYKYK